MRWCCIAIFVALPSQVVAAPSADDLTQRRAIRGRPVETLHESDALRQLRDFEQSAFPPPNALAPDFDEVTPSTASAASPSNTGGRPGVGPD